MTDEELEMTCFSLITSAGTAKSNYIQAIACAREGDYARAEELIAAGDEALVAGHEPHTRMVQKEAVGEKTDVSILLVHAEDQMATTETFKVMALEIIALYKRLDGQDAPQAAQDGE